MSKQEMIDDKMCSVCSSWPCRCLEMAQDRIKELEAENKRLRAALEKIASGWIDPANGTDCKNCDMGLYQNLGHLPECVFEIAREALK